jgi:hypothetical protein
MYKKSLALSALSSKISGEGGGGEGGGLCVCGPLATLGWRDRKRIIIWVRFDVQAFGYSRHFAMATYSNDM